jgi:probable lipoprotein (TIGR04455 family)
MRFFSIFLISQFLVGCTVCAYVKPDFAKTDRHSLKRIGIYVTRTEAAPLKAYRLLARMTRRSILQYKDYLAAEEGLLYGAKRWQKKCNEELDGILAVEVEEIADLGTETAFTATFILRRCKDNVVVWKAEGRVVNEKKDTDLAELAKVYEDEYGQVAQRYAAPFFVLVKAAIATLPSPKLNDEEIMEKIALDD